MVALRGGGFLCLWVASALSVPAHAKETDDIVVTASRIVRPDNQNSALISVIDSNGIARSGQINIAEALRRQPDFASGINPGNSNFRATGFGANLLDLRGLGLSRTLVLVNGQRFVGGLGGTTAVDINMIPTDRLDRVEVVTGGTSAVYGSDAVAGVVNFILKDRFVGAIVNAQSGISGRGDAPRERISGMLGSDFASGRGNIWIDASYDRDAGLLSSARSVSATDPLGRSVFPAQGAFGLNGTIFDVAGFSPTEGLLLGDYTYGSDGALKKGFAQASDGYDRNPYRRISVPLQRVLVNSGLTFDISPATSFHAEFLFGQTRTSTAVEPYAAAGGDPAVDGAGSIDVAGGLAIGNAYIPAAVASEIAARNSDDNTANDVAFIAFKRRLGDIYDRNSRSLRRTYRATLSLKGEAWGDWRWDASYVYGRTTDHSATPTLLVDRFAKALDAVTIGGATVCRDAAARAAGCQPLDIFGAGSPSAAAIAYVRGGNAATVLDTTLEQQVVSANLSGAILALPAGPVRLSLGAEYRHEYAFDNWDADTNAGNTLATFANDTRGSYDGGSVYGELAVPLVADRPLAHYLGIEGAARYDHHSSSGGIVSWRVGGDWAPTATLRFRTSYAAASRAPNIAELYTTRKETAVGLLAADPCNGVTATRANAYDVACRSLPGVAQAIQNGGTFSYSPAEIQSINGFGGGNPNLRAERARTFTVGAVMRPEIPGSLSLSVDYYNISITGAIGGQPRDETIKYCLVDPASAMCNGLVQRLPNGKITRVDAYLVNTGAVRQSGIDVALDYSIGGFGVQGKWTHLLRQQRQSYAGAAFVDELGQLQDAAHSRLGSGYRDRFTAAAIYSRGAASLSWTTRYYGPIVDTKDASIAPPAVYNLVPAACYHDVQLRVKLDGEKRRELYFGIDNLFDRAPPFLPGDLTASGLVGVESAQEYDAVGRYLYVGVTARF